MFALASADLAFLARVGTAYNRNIGREVYDLSDKQQCVIRYWLRWLTSPTDLQTLLPKLTNRDLQLLAKVASRVTVLYAKSNWQPSPVDVSHMVEVVEHIHAFRADRAIAHVRKKEDIPLIEHTPE